MELLESRLSSLWQNTGGKTFTVGKTGVGSGLQCVIVLLIVCTCRAGEYDAARRTYSRAKWSPLRGQEAVRRETGRKWPGKETARPLMTCFLYPDPTFHSSTTSPQLVRVWTHQCISPFVKSEGLWSNYSQSGTIRHSLHQGLQLQHMSLLMGKLFIHSKTNTKL